MPPGVYQPGAPPPAPPKPPKKSPPKKAPKVESKKPMWDPRVALQKADQKKQGKVDFTDIVRRAVQPAVDVWNPIRNYTPAPAIEHVVKKATPAPARVLTKASKAIDTGIGTGLDVLGSIPGTFTMPIHPGQTTTPVQRVKPISTAALAQRINTPSRPHFQIGTAYLAPQYQAYFKGQSSVSTDDLRDAMAQLSSGKGPAKWPINDAQTNAMLKKIKANGWDLKDSKHWTWDDFVVKSIQKNEPSALGFVRHALAGGVQLSALPSGLVAGGAAAVAAAGGNTKPAQEFGQSYWDFTKSGLPFIGPKPFLQEVYENPVGVAANILPAFRGLSAFGGKALLSAGERDIRLPGTGGTVRTHVPADLAARASHEVRKGLIERQKPGGSGPLTSLGRRLETKQERRIAEHYEQRAELQRDQAMRPVMEGISQARRNVVNREGKAPSLGKLSTVLQPGKHTGGQRLAAQIVERARTGMTFAELRRYREQVAQDARHEQQRAIEASRAWHREADLADAEGDSAAAASALRAAHDEDVRARNAGIEAANNEAHGEFLKGAEDAKVPPDHPLLQAVVRASQYISERKQEMAPAKGGLTDRSRLFGDLETKLRASARDAQDSELRQAARNDNPDSAAMLEAQRRVRRGDEAQEILELRQREHDLRTQADVQKRREDFQGRSHTEREALGGLKETERATEREIGHIDTESDILHAAQQRLEKRTPPTIGETPFTQHEGVSPTEHAKIQEDLQNIAEVHIDRERTKRAGIRTEIGTVRHALSDPDLTPLARTRLEARRDQLIDKLNTPSPRTIYKIQREIDSYLGNFGKRITTREKRAYQAKLIVKKALVKQASGDHLALSQRSRKLEQRIVQQKANSSRTLRGQADRVGAEYEQKMQAFERHYGGGAHADLLQPPVERGGLRGFRNPNARGVLPRQRTTKVSRSTGKQVRSASYSPEETVNGLINNIRTLSDHAASTGLYNSLLTTDLVRSAANLEGELVPEGWHWVSEGNLARFTNHPLHATSSEHTAGLLNDEGTSVAAGAWKSMLKELKDVKRRSVGIVPHENGYLIRESGLQALEDAVRRHDAGDFGVIQKITNEYRKFLLFTLPRTFVNNMLGNIGLSVLSGASMMDIVRASHLLQNHPEVIPSLIRNRGLVASQFGPDAATGGWMDMWRRANTFAEDLGQAATYIAQVRKYGKEQGLSARGATGLLKGMDDISSDWYRVMNDLATGKDPNVIPLMQRSKQFFGDVAKQTRANKLLSTTILFHRWLGHIARLVAITLPVHYPGRFSILVRLSQIGDDYRKQHGVLPEWAQGVVRLAMDSVKTPAGVQQVVTGLSTTGINPAQSFSQVADLGTDSNPVFPGLAILGGAASPVVSVPIQALSGINLQTGRRFTDRYGNEIGPGQNAALAGHLLWQNAPLLSTLLSTANTSADSSPWNQAVAASSPSAYRRQLANPAAIRSSSPKALWAVALRAAGVPITRLDAYGPRYNQHLSSMAFALEKQEKDKQNKNLKPPAKTAPTAPPPAIPPAKPMTPEQRREAQKAYAKKLRSGNKSGDVAKRRKEQQDYAKKLRAARG